MSTGRSKVPLDARQTADFESRLAAYRERVGVLLRASVPDREPRRYLYDLISGHLAREGKGIRPALCLATCGSFGGDLEQALPSAAAIELLHNAFLVHDDVEDGSEYRRDRPTLHRQYGIPLAVNAGDAMNAMSLRVLKRNFELFEPHQALAIVDEFDRMSLETIEGQAMELGWIRDNRCDTTEDDYLCMVLKKTCFYSFIQPCRVGALIAGQRGSSLDAFNRFGYFLGAAFQIQDDILNLVGDRRKYGKEIGGDILEGKRTLILAHAMQSADIAQRERLRAFLAKPRNQRLSREVAWVHDFLVASGSIAHAGETARRFVEGARREFDVAYQGAIPGEDTTFVRLLLDYVVARSA